LVMTAATPNMKCLGFMELLLGAPDSSACAGAALASGGRGGRYGFQIRNDGVDLRTLQIVLEPRHARGSLADETANDLVIAAGGFLRERRTIGAGVDRGRQMTDPARLREDLPAVLLGGIEPAGRLLSQGARTGERKHEGHGQKDVGASQHARSSRLARFALHHARVLDRNPAGPACSWGNDFASAYACGRAKGRGVPFMPAMRLREGYSSAPHYPRHGMNSARIRAVCSPRAGTGP